MIYRRLSGRVGLTLAMLGLVLTLCALLLGCAIPCRPTVSLAASPHLAATPADGIVEGLGMSCVWSY